MKAGFYYSTPLRKRYRGMHSKYGPPIPLFLMVYRWLDAQSVRFPLWGGGYVHGMRPW